MKTITEIRESFWTVNPHLAHHRRSRKRQNQYNGWIRSAFVEHVDGLQKSGEISEKLADRATL